MSKLAKKVCATASYGARERAVRALQLSAKRAWQERRRRLVHFYAKQWPRTCAGSSLTTSLAALAGRSTTISLVAAAVCSDSAAVGAGCSPMAAAGMPSVDTPAIAAILASCTPKALPGKPAGAVAHEGSGEASCKMPKVRRSGLERLAPMAATVSAGRTRSARGLETDVGAEATLKGG